MVKRQRLERTSDIEEVGDPSSADVRYRDYSTFLQSSAAERRLLKERIAEADKGVFISAEAMHRWMESWGTENELPPPEPDIFPTNRRS